MTFETLLSRLNNARNLCTFILCCLISATANAQDIIDLERNNEVTLQAWVGEQPDRTHNKSNEFSVNEQVILTIEVATPQWFTGGTRIGSVEVPHLIAKQRNQLATNYTERKEGQTWSHQRWELTLYPQESGEFVIPPIAVSLHVSASDGSKVSGTLYTQPIKFNVSLPSGLLSDNEQWFTASDVTAKQQWQTSNEKLKVGDAITRTVEISAQDSLSVLLPNLLTGKSNTAYQSYPQPHKLEDKQARGNYQSSRTEETVYVIQQGGEITLPELTFQWWNNKTKKLETVVLEGKSFTAKHTVSSFIKAYFTWIVSLVVILILVVSLIIAIRRYYQTHPLPEWLLFDRLVKTKNWSKIRVALYKQGRVHTSKLEMSKMDNSKAWQSESERFLNGEESTRLMKSMWKKIQAKEKQWRFTIPKALPGLDKIGLSNIQDKKQ